MKADAVADAPTSRRPSVQSNKSGAKVEAVPNSPRRTPSVASVKSNVSKKSAAPAVVEEDAPAENNPAPAPVQNVDIDDEEAKTIDG